MWIDQHPYLFIYLLGGGVGVILFILRVILAWFISWITKGNILNTNLKKILPPDKKPFWNKAILHFSTLIIEAVISWLSVIYSVWYIIVTLLHASREVLSSTPEAIKLLRYPLRNNPNLSREAVWAYWSALQIKFGEKTPSESELLFSLDELSQLYQFFDREAALNHLNDLNVMSVDVISSALSNLSSVNRET